VDLGICGFLRRTASSSPGTMAELTPVILAKRLLIFLSERIVVKSMARPRVVFAGTGPPLSRGF
jgi:hypothetical protein